jgi:uncharacterized damage-inducible protein DinB
MPFLDSLARVLHRDLRAFQRELALFPTEEAVWQVLPGVANSAGNLALHVAGNLQHFVGHALGGTDYRRNRDQEFAQRGLSREELCARLADTEAMLARVLPTLAEADLEAPYPAAPGIAVSAEQWLLHLATHLAFHLGQAGLLRRALTGSKATSGAMGLKELGTT